jgi:hypothetical protein
MTAKWMSVLVIPDNTDLLRPDPNAAAFSRAATGTSTVTPFLIFVIALASNHPCQQQKNYDKLTGHLLNSSHGCKTPMVGAHIGYSRSAWRLWRDAAVSPNSYFFSPIVELEIPTKRAGWLDVRAHYNHHTMRDRIFYPEVFSNENLK